MHIGFGQFHLFLVQNVAVLHADVVFFVEEALLLYPCHVEDVQFFRYPNIRFVLISPPELRIPDYIKESVLDANNVTYRETTNLDDAMEDPDPENPGSPQFL